MLITGITGLLGSEIRVHAGDDFEIFGIARNPSAFALDCAVIRLDLMDRREAICCMQETRPHVIVHCAAMTDVDQCEEETEAAWELHVEASRALAEWAEEHDCYFIYISTDSVFDGRTGNYNELDLPAPLNEYARTKLQGEIEVREVNPPALILRTNFYGIGGTRSNLAAWMFRELGSTGHVKAFADVYFNPLPAASLAEIILQLVKSNAQGTFHVGAKNSCSKYEFACQLAAEFDFNPDRISPMSANEFPFKARRPRNTTLDVRKISICLGREMPKVQDGLNELRKQMYMKNGALPFLRPAELTETGYRK